VRDDPFGIEERSSETLDNKIDVPSLITLIGSLSTPRRPTLTK
jgi:hypothetical protein